MTRNKNSAASVTASDEKPLTAKQKAAAAKKLAKEKENTINDNPFPSSVLESSSDNSSEADTSMESSLIKTKPKKKNGTPTTNQIEKSTNKKNNNNPDPPTTTTPIELSSDDTPDGDTSMEISPIKKKRRPATNKRSVTTQKERLPTTNEPPSTAPETPARSSLKQGRYGVRPSTPAPERMHLHNHKRVVVEAAFAFDRDDDRFKTFLSALASLLTFCRMVDEHFIINPVKENSRDKDWSDPTSLPTSMTALGAYFLTSGNSRIFEKARAGPKAKNGKKDSRPQAVYFTFAISSDLDPKEIMARVSVDWSMLGGTRLTVKSLGFFNTSTPIAIYFLWNEGHAPTLLEEFKTILNSVSHLESGGANLPLPQMSLWKQVPRTPGQVTETFNHLSFQAQMARKAWHVEVQS